ncbi:hypothetical protein [Citrobacter rodentium]|jgi:hypothetical protein|uniref:Uncharacterized protein n=2 Tax=Citrobacter rodentium TaxID=67825 RepID=D2TLJ8_CITRI|nr:hypothetical protein [Citrobacter rodentium]QBY30653.1 hypothetical protein E2R62_18660 [Citrobacter rodentium]UHO31977.1 hypothetical protein K7R23_04515 [Citrobacter rodentium NBRC 105723 = DSM 16636]CBG91078.1 hypothetical protein ROD_43821 [Citrobacter rodentium ICC168]HAT8011294.1 hypothetical protein [Citrobacter rodentium NBRC 105723 = DSM 16636]HAT8016109.1 hypothetical protein [Citrobacter rodentium]
MKKTPLNVLEQKAKEISRNILKDYILTDEIFAELTSGVIIDGDDRIFVLYIPKQKAKDTIDILRIRMNIYSGEGVVEYVGLERKKDTITDESDIDQDRDGS